MEFDLFISHASEDKDEVARPLAQRLRAKGLRVWIDETEIRLGDSLRRSIDRGLAGSRFGLVILSPWFLKKDWTQKELDGLVAREDGSAKVILPVWHNLSKSEVAAYSPLLADRLSATTSAGLDNVADQILKAIAPIVEATESESDAPREHDIHTVLAGLIDRITDESQHDVNEVTGLRTGLLDLDRNLSGLQPQSLNLVAARPSVGSTGFCIGLAVHAACDSGLPVLVVSPHEPASQIGSRLICNVGAISSWHFATRRFDEREWTALTEAIERLSRAPIEIVDDPHITINQIEAASKRAKQKFGALSLVYVDDVQAIAANSALETEEVCRRLKLMARDCKGIVLASSRLNRSVETRADKRPHLADLREFGDLERHADVVVFLYRDELHNPQSQEPGVAEIIVARHRAIGITGTIKVHFDRDSGRFSDFIQPDAPLPDA